MRTIFETKFSKKTILKEDKIDRWSWRRHRNLRMEGRISSLVFVSTSFLIIIWFHFYPIVSSGHLIRGLDAVCVKLVFWTEFKSNSFLGWSSLDSESEFLCERELSIKWKNWQWVVNKVWPTNLFFAFLLFPFLCQLPDSL